MGYALSRLDLELVRQLGFKSWTEAYKGIGKKLSAPPKSIKGLRDEFDPLHGHRKGWWKRPMLPNRVRIVEELGEASDEALVELVRHLLRGESEDTDLVLDTLAQPTGVPAAAAERMLTGRLAEEYVLANANRVLSMPKRELRDRRDDLVGFDFEARGIAIEVKGLQGMRGALLFTDREWFEARHRRRSYWLAVVGNVRQAPQARLLKDPAAHLDPRCRYEQAVRAVWRTPFDVAG